MSRREELRAAGRLVGTGLAGVVDVVADVHAAVSRRVESMLPRPMVPFAAGASGVAAAVYAGVSAAHRIVPAVAGEVLACTAGADAPPLSRTRLGALVVPAVNGLWGDHVARAHPALAVPMAVRTDGLDLDLGSDDADGRERVRQAFPAATRRLVVFVHGLAESDRSWWWAADREDGGQRAAGLSGEPVATPAGTDRHGRETYGDRLRADLGFTPVYVRYNSGLPVGENGQALSDLLHRLVARWPVTVGEVCLVGHSMGGLVVRSACRHGDVVGHRWVRLLRAVVTLGTPHLGAPLEKAVHTADWLLSTSAETRPLARLLAARSAGIQDLRFGAVLVTDSPRPGEFLRDRCGPVPLVDHAASYAVAATLTRGAAHPVGHLLGDGLVRAASATGTGLRRTVPFAPDRRSHLTGLHHFGLLNHPQVYAQLRSWLAGDAAAHPLPDPAGAPTTADDS